MTRARFSACLLGLAAFLAIDGQHCLADTISFNFTGGVSTAAAGVSSLTFTGSPPVPALSLTARATAGGNITRDATNGLGVSDASAPDAFLVNNGETLEFDFTPNTVSFDRITFTVVDTAGNGDNAVIVRITSPQTTLFNQAISTSATGTVQLDLTSFASATSRQGLKFSISAADGNDDFGVGGLTVDFTPAAPAVPLPTSAAMGLVLFAGVGLLRRSRGLA
jgi:hypothetical protein